MFFLADNILMILGPWSDRHGRKIPLLMGHFGVCISLVTYLVIFYIKTIPSEYVLIGSVATGITGSYMNLFANCAGYICDVTPESSRTFRLTFLYSMSRLGSLAGNFLGGIVITQWDYGVFFAAWTVAAFVILLYGIFLIKNVIPKQKEASKESEKKSVHPLLKKLKLDKFMASFRITMMKREGYTRGKILALCGAMCAPIIAGMGKYQNIYLSRT